MRLGGRPRCLDPDVVVFKLKRTLVQRRRGSDIAIARVALNENSYIDGDDFEQYKWLSLPERLGALVGPPAHELSLWSLTAVWAVSGFRSAHYIPGKTPFVRDTLKPNGHSGCEGREVRGKSINGPCSEKEIRVRWRKHLIFEYITTAKWGWRS